MHNYRNKLLLWTFVYFIMLFSVIVPPTGLITVHFMMIPLVVLYVKLKPRAFVLFYVTVHVPIVLLLMSYAVLPISFSLFFVVPAIVMGTLYKRKSEARTVVTAGVIVILAELILVLAGISLSGVDIRDTLNDTIRDSLAYLPDMFQETYTDEVVMDLVDLVIQSIPFYFICIALYLTALTHTLGRRALAGMGETVNTFKPIREWMVPRSFIWYYLIGYVIAILVNPEIGSFWSVITSNLIPLMMLVFSVQAISFIFFLAYQKKWSVAVPVISIVALVVMFTFLVQVYSFLGVLDAAFPIRDRFRQKG